MWIIIVLDESLMYIEPSKAFWKLNQPSHHDCIFFVKKVSNIKTINSFGKREYPGGKKCKLTYMLIWIRNCGS